MLKIILTPDVKNAEMRPQYQRLFYTRRAHSRTSLRISFIGLLKIISVGQKKREKKNDEGKKRERVKPALGRTDKYAKAWSLLTNFSVLFRG